MLLQSKSCEYKQRVRAHVDSAHFPLQQTVCCVDSTQSQTTLSALNFFNLPATLPCNICLPVVGVLSSHCWKLCTVICVGGLKHEYLSKNSLLQFKEIIKSYTWNRCNYSLPYSVLPTGYYVISHLSSTTPSPAVLSLLLTNLPFWSSRICSPNRSVCSRYYSFATIYLSTAQDFTSYQDFNQPSPFIVVDNDET